jgi:hypothetical protein
MVFCRQLFQVWKTDFWGPENGLFLLTPQTSLQAASPKPKKWSQYLQNCSTQIHAKDSILSLRWRFFLKRQDSFAF